MTGGATMRAAFFGQPGPAEAIEVGELPVPVPGPLWLRLRPALWSTA
jgi:hypothetical protein